MIRDPERLRSYDAILPFKHRGVRNFNTLSDDGLSVTMLCRISAREVELIAVAAPVPSNADAKSKEVVARDSVLAKEVNKGSNTGSQSSVISSRMCGLATIPCSPIF